MVNSHDILLIGKTGSGKRTTAKKLIHKPTYHNQGPCEVLTSKEQRIRVMSTPLYDEGVLTGRTISQMHLQIVCSMIHVQATMKMTWKRVVYFLPYRGALEKVDGAFRDELHTMYHFFGPAIFESMVVVATNSPRKQKYGFDDEDRKETQHILHTTLKFATGDENIFCPPIVYIALCNTGEEILDTLLTTTVKNKNGIVLNFRDDVCIKCGDRYTKAPGSGKHVDSRCHPKFVPKYTTTEKFLVRSFKASWSEWTNDEEVCERCRCERGSPGCCTVDGKTVDHSSTL